MLKSVLMPTDQASQTKIAYNLSTNIAIPELLVYQDFQHSFSGNAICYFSDAQCTIIYSVHLKTNKERNKLHCFN